MFVPKNAAPPEPTSREREDAHRKRQHLMYSLITSPHLRCRRKRIALVSGH